jgi:hypothetical protein
VHYVPPQPLRRQGKAYRCCEEQVEKWLGQAWVLLSEARGKGVYLFRSKMSVLNYLTKAPHNYAVDDNNMQVIEEAARSIGGRDTIQEFQACGIWLLSDD